MHVHYEHWDDQKTNAYFDELVLQLAASPGVVRVCDVGGGANPRLPVEHVKKYGLDYTILDISAEELAKAPDEYHKVCGDVTAPDLALNGCFDLIFSRMVAEHVFDGGVFHRNVFKMLAPGGVAVHIFPTLYNLPFTVNRILPESLTEKILLMIKPHRKKSGKIGKFPAYYSWCYGPRASQLERLQEIGYEVDEYVGVYGHDSYYKKLKPLLWLHRSKSSFLAKHPVPLLTSFAVVRLRKPA